MLDFEDIIQKTVLSCDVEVAVNNLLALDGLYSQDELVEIYNYALKNLTNPDILMNIIKLSDRFRDASTIPVLTDLLLKKFDDENNQEVNDKIVNLHAMCAKALGNFKNTDAVQPLLYCLNNKDEHYKVRLNCADALGRIGDKYAVAPLIEIMKDEDEKSVYVRESAATALGILGDMSAIEPLVSILETKQGIMSKFTFLKERVIEALSKLKLDANDRVFRALKTSLEDESVQVRINAIEALMESNHPKSVEVIKTCLNNNDEEVRKNALIALYNLIGRDILDEVISLPIYCEDLKREAKCMIEEYEEDV